MKFILRHWIRNKTKPIDKDTARKWQKRLAICYGVIGWNLGTMAIYHTLKGRYPDSDVEDPCKQFAKHDGIREATVYKYDGFRKVGEYKIFNEDIPEGEYIGLGITQGNYKPPEEK